MDGAPGPRIRPPRSYDLPEVPAEFLTAVQAGEAPALLRWADALADRGATAGADLLRWLPRFHDRIAEEVRLVAPSGGFFVNCVSWREHAAWVIGDCDCEIENQDTRNLDELLAAWNDFHLAVEWLHRQFGLPTVVVEAHALATGRLAERRSFNLAAGEHFTPFGPGVRVLHLRAEAYEPEE